MKLLFLFLAFFLVTNIFSQTKQETIYWINQKFQASPFLQSKLSDGRVSSTTTRFLKIKNDGTFQIDENVYYADNWLFQVPDNTYKVKGDFKDLSVNSLSTKVEGNNLLIYAYCYSGNCLEQINKDGTTVNTPSTLIGLLDISSDRSMIERCKKAFLHLIKLCGGKSEAF